jgi:anti-anti-sigma factor
MERVAVTKAEQTEPGVIVLSGDLLFSTVTRLRHQLETLLRQQQGRCVLDFSGAGRVDSSALALWLACWREARRLGIELSVRELPADLKSIADLVGLDEALG